MIRETVERCAVPECFAEGQHLPTCDDRDTCSGCAPGLAMGGGILICRHHRDLGVRSLKKLPAVQSDLLVRMSPYASPQAPSGDGGRSAETPDVLNEAAFEQRQLIHEWCAILVAYAITKQELTIRPRWDVPRMVRFLLRHADWLSSDPATAWKWATKVDSLAFEGRRIAASARKTGTYLGACPMTVAKDGEQDVCGGPIHYQRDSDDPSDPTWLITCPWCKHEETALWWAQRINPTARKIHLANAAGVAAHLSLKYVIDLKVRKKAIDELTIRNWAWRQLSGQHRADCVDKDGTRPNLDCRGCRPAFDAVACSLKSRRLLYDVDEVESHARKVYGFADLDLEEAS